MASFPPPPAGLDLKESKVPSLFSAFIITYIFAVACVILRVIARKVVRKAGLWWDDWLSILSLVWALGFLLDVIAFMVPNGFGKHIWAASGNPMKAFFIGLFVAEYMFTLSLCFIKWSMLAFYWRIFGTEKKTKAAIWFIFAVVCAWGLAVLLVTTFQCMPVSAFWTRFDPLEAPAEFTCGVNVKNFFIANAIPNMITDILMLLIPLPTIWNLKLRQGQRMGLMGIFAVGLFVTAISVVRLVYLFLVDFTNPDVTWLFSDEMMWTGVEVNIGIVCACMPSLKPVLNLVLYHTALTSSAQKSRSASKAGLGGTGGTGMGELQQKWDNGGIRLDSQDRGHTDAYVSSKLRHDTDDTRPLSNRSADNDSDEWTEYGRIGKAGNDLEMSRIEKPRKTATGLPTKGSRDVVVTTTVGIHRS